VRFFSFRNVTAGLLVSIISPRIDGFTLAGWIKNDARLAKTVNLMVAANGRTKHG
jgi:hypothetical protein